MDARQAVYHIANRKQWEARIAKIEEHLEGNVNPGEVHRLTGELERLRDKLDGYYLRREKEGD